MRAPRAEYSYTPVGRTAYGVTPPGFRALRVRIPLGTGWAVFAAAARALLEWRMHRAMGVRLEADAGRAAPGVRVTVGLGVGALRVGGPCRVVWAVEEERRARVVGVRDAAGPPAARRGGLSRRTRARRRRPADRAGLQCARGVVDAGGGTRAAGAAAGLRTPLRTGAARAGPGVTGALRGARPGVHGTPSGALREGPHRPPQMGRLLGRRSFYAPVICRSWSGNDDPRRCSYG